MSNKHSKATPNWKLKAIHGAVALMVANTVFVPNAMAVMMECGATISSAVAGPCLATNDSTISISSSGSVNATSGPAIYYDQNLAGSLTNNGTISSNGVGSSWWSPIVGVEIANELTGTLTNTGTIRAIANNTSGNAYAYGIREGGVPDMSGTLTNSGTINATAISTNGGYATAYGVYVSGNLSGALSNSGTISASATNLNSSSAYAVGVYVGGELSGTGTLTNSGTISATANAVSGTAYAAGVYIGSLGGTFTNTGTIRATAVGSNASAAGVVINYLNGGVLNNSGTISGSADGGEGNSLIISSGSGTVNNNAGGVLRGNLYVGGDVAVNNAGTIEIPVTPGVGAGNGYISGNYTQSASGLVALGAASDSVYSQLTVNGTADLTGSNRIGIHATPNNTLSVGDTLDNVFSANIGWTGLASGATVTVVGTPLFTFSGLEDGENHIDITVTSKNSFSGLLGNIGGSGGIGGTLDGLVAGYTGTGALDGVLDQLYATNSLAELQGDVNQLLPLLTTGTTAVISNTLHGTNRIIQARQDSNKGMSSGDNFLGNRSFWLKPVGSWANQNDRNGVSGYDAATFGLVLGADSEISATSRVGVAFSYMHSNVDSNTAQQHAKIDGYQAIVYGSHILDERTELNLQADIGYNQNDGRRAIPLMGVVAKSDYDSWSAHIGAGLGRRFDLSPKTTFTPSVRADYAYIRDQGYTESGAGALNLNVSRNNTDELILAAEGKISHAVTDHAKVTANLGLGYDVLSDRTSITSAFAGGGAAFTTEGIDPSPWLVRGGLGLVMTTSNAVEVTARYDVEVREGFDNQTASVKARWAF